MFVLVICEILSLFINTLSADDKYSLHNSYNLQQTIQLMLSKKEKNFSQFLTPFLKSTLNFEYFENNDDPHTSYIFDVMDFERCDYR